MESDLKHSEVRDWVTRLVLLWLDLKVRLFTECGNQPSILEKDPIIRHAFTVFPLLVKFRKLCELHPIRLSKLAMDDFCRLTKRFSYRGRGIANQDLGQREYIEAFNLIV